MTTYNELYKDVRPNWNVHPGEIVAEYLEYNGWTQKDLATRTGVTPKHINELIKGKKDLSPEMASKLSMVFGTSMELWNNLNSRYIEQKAYLEKLDALRAEKAWLKEIPAAWMEKMGWVSKFKDAGQRVEALLRFFAVTSVNEWRATLSSYNLAFRQSKTFKTKDGAVLAWIRKAEIEAASLTDKPLSIERLKNSLSDLKKLTNEPEPAVFMPRLREILGESGVRIVFIQAPPGCPVHAATVWKGSRCIIANSGRFRSDDQFWFSLFHEIGHILLKHKGIAKTDEQEREADAFASNMFIPEAFSETLKKTKTKSEILTLSRKAGVPAGIVVGRLQHDALLPHGGTLEALKVRYDGDAFR